MNRIARSALPGLALAALLLGAAGLQPAANGFRRAAGARSLLQALLVEPGPGSSRPFPCAAEPLQSDDSRRLAVDALKRLETLPEAAGSSAHLRETASCLLGDRQRAEELYRADSSPYALVQQAVLLDQQGRSEESAALLAQAGLNRLESMALLKTLLEDLPELDWRPHLRQLAGLYPQEPMLWQFWLLVNASLDRAGQYTGSRDWLAEGLAIQAAQGEAVYRSSFEMRIGRIDQIHSDPARLESALAHYDRAIELDEFLYASDPGSTYFYRGEVYQNIKGKYSTEQVLAEYNRALALSPNPFWPLLGLGHVYLYDLQDNVQAESYYRQAFELEPELPQAYYYLGDLARVNGNLQLAETWFKLALARQPDFQPAIERLKELGASP